MLHFVLCDDNPRHNQTLLYHLQQLLPQMPVSCGIALATTDPGEVMAYAAQPHAQTVYLLDLVLEQELTGLDVCSAIRRTDPNAYVIYVSAYAEYAMDCCRSHAFDFILKPYTRQRLENALRDVIQHIARSKPAQPLSVTAGTVTRLLDQREIRYLKMQREYVTACLGDGHVTWRESLSKLLPRLNADWFVRVHKSYAINRLYLQKVDALAHEVTLTGDIVLPVSRRVVKTLLEPPRI